jgi:ketosteroid isomerase-like protein
MDAREIVRQALRDLDEPGGTRFVDSLTEDAEMMTPFGVFTGHDAIREFVGGMHQSFTEWHHDVKLEAAGDVVAIEGTWNGTHTGPMPSPQGEVAPTGKRATIPFAGIVRIRDGRIASVHNYFDQMTFMGQLGLLPEPAAVGV